MQDMLAVQNRKTICVRLQPNNISELKRWDMLNLYLIGPYIKSIRQHHISNATINKYVSLTFMIIIEPSAGWFVISKG